MNATTQRELRNLGNLEITPDALILHFHEENTVIPLSQIGSYRLKWYLHDPIFAKKWWFLVLTVTLKNGDEESGHITSVKFNYLRDDSKLRKDIENKIAHAINSAFLQASLGTKNHSSFADGCPDRSMLSSERRRAHASPCRTSGHDRAALFIQFMTGGSYAEFTCGCYQRKGRSTGRCA